MVYRLRAWAWFGRIVASVFWLVMVWNVVEMYRLSEYLDAGVFGVLMTAFVLLGSVMPHRIEFRETCIQLSFLVGRRRVLLNRSSVVVSQRALSPFAMSLALPTYVASGPELPGLTRALGGIQVVPWWFSESASLAGVLKELVDRGGAAT